MAQIIRCDRCEKEEEIKIKVEIGLPGIVAQYISPKGWLRLSGQASIEGKILCEGCVTLLDTWIKGGL